jgi:hypothetical protein
LSECAESIVVRRLGRGIAVGPFVSITIEQP